MRLIKGDCLGVMEELINEGVKVDMVLTDPPYGTTACKWDSVIDFEAMWSRLKQLRKDSSAIVLFGNEPFSSALRMSNIKEYKYDWIWDKHIPSGMSYARFRPMQQTENICVFGIGRLLYNPQMIKRDKIIKSGGVKSSEVAPIKYKDVNFKKTYEFKNPITTLYYKKIRQGSLHPTQKPVELLEYLIRTYTNEGDLVLDFTMGSGSTGVACKNLNRRFIGIELDEKYFEIAKNRIENS